MGLAWDDKLVRLQAKTLVAARTSIYRYLGASWLASLISLDWRPTV